MNRASLTAAPVTGQPVARVDGRLKVTGQATYAAEFDVGQPVTYGVAVGATIARGRIMEIDTSEAEQADGVLAVLTHENAPRLVYREHRDNVDPPDGERIHMLQDDRVYYQDQHIALVVATTFEQATYAASLLRVTYQEEPAITDFAAAELVSPGPNARDGGISADTRRGDPDRALMDAPVRIQAEYVIPRENHNPMELHATIASWEGETLTLWDKTQWVDNTRDEIAAIFGLPGESVRVISPFVGGAFGASLRTWPHVTLAALGARHVGKPVKVVLTRRQNFSNTGYRPHTVQRVALGAERDGKLVALRHEGTEQTSTYERYVENLLNASRFMYTCPNVSTRYRLAPMDVSTPTYMRAPGEVSGMFALECAIDELAWELNMDPIELRRLNEPERNEHEDLPFSSRSLLDCFDRAGRRFGWKRRAPQPASMRDAQGHLLGFGCAAATYPVYMYPAAVCVQLHPDGTARVATAASDMGPGTYTSMTQIAADALGLPMERVRFVLGDTNLPRAPVHGGSLTMGSVGPAVQAACALARRQALERGGVPGNHADLSALLQRMGEVIEVTGGTTSGEELNRIAEVFRTSSMHSFGAVFAEVAVDPDLGLVRVPRLVGAYAAGRIVNPRLARSQCAGAMVMGVGMALLEHTIVDPRTGRVINSTLADYLVPVNADIHQLDVSFVDEQDDQVNSLGVKGIAELPIVGVAAAIANAVYHATGQRVRDLPITAEKLLPSLPPG